MKTSDQTMYARIHECVVSREKELIEVRDREERVEIIVASMQHYSDLPGKELRQIARQVINQEFSDESREDIRWTRYFVGTLASILIIYLLLQL